MSLLSVLASLVVAIPGGVWLVTDRGALGTRPGSWLPIPSPPAPLSERCWFTLLRRVSGRCEVLPTCPIPSGP